MASNTAQQAQDWMNGPVGQALGGIGQQVANGSITPEQGLATAATALAGQGNQSVNDFLQSQGGHLLQQYVANVAGGTPPGQALSSMAGAVASAGAAAGLSALGVPPPASTMLAQVAGSLVDQLAHSLFGGEANDTEFPNLSGDFRWRARKYFTKCLPQSFVDYMRASGLSVERAIIEPPSGQSPPWNGLSTAISLWLMKGAWGTPQIMLPGVTASRQDPNNYCHQFFIPYSLPWNAGDGWGMPVNGPGWWWYPYFDAATMAALDRNERPANPGPIWETYERIGIDVLATRAACRAKQSAEWSNVVYRPQGYSIAADEVEQAVHTPETNRTRGQQAIVNTIKGGAPAKLGGAGGAAVIAAALLLMRKG